jgi:DNA-directed RNA polymerase specialized sigma24 family protein
VDDVDSATNAPERAGHELRSVLDEELERLPAKYRAPLVFCYLERMTVDEMIEHLGWPQRIRAFGRNGDRHLEDSEPVPISSERS